MARNKIKAKNKRKGSNKATGRNYDYDKAYAARPEQKKRRAARNRARRKMLAAGKVRKGQDVNHKDGNPLNSKMSNLAAESKKKNRGRKKKK